MILFVHCIVVYSSGNWMAVEVEDPLFVCWFTLPVEDYRCSFIIVGAWSVKDWSWMEFTQAFIFKIWVLVSVQGKPKSSFVASQNQI